MIDEERIRKAVRNELSRLNEARMVTYTSKILSDIVKNVPRMKDAVVPEEVRQALWMAFGEKADRIEFVGDDGKYYSFKIFYNETFDESDSTKALRRLSDIESFGRYELAEKGKGFLVAKYVKGTGDKYTFAQLMAEL